MHYYCKKCGAVVDGNYCSCCGTKATSSKEEFQKQLRKARKQYKDEAHRRNRLTGMHLADLAWMLAEWKIVPGINGSDFNPKFHNSTDLIAKVKQHADEVYNYSFMAIQRLEMDIK